MPKGAETLIKEDERKVLHELLEDSGQSVNVIAKKLGFSRQKVWRIIKQLEKNNTIWGSTAVVDETKIGQKSYTVLIRRTTEPLSGELTSKIIKRNIEPAAKKLGVMIDSSFYVHGMYDWIICFSAEDIGDAKQFGDVLLRAYTGYIADLQILETLFWIQKHGRINPEREKLKKFL